MVNISFCSTFILTSPMANAAQAKVVLLQRYKNSPSCFIFGANSCGYLSSVCVCVFTGS